MTTPEHAKPPSVLSINAVLEEKVILLPGRPPRSSSSSLSLLPLFPPKGFQVPVLGQPALPGQLGSHGHSIPTMGKWCCAWPWLLL